MLNTTQVTAARIGKVTSIRLIIKEWYFVVISSETNPGGSPSSANRAQAQARGNTPVYFQIA